MSHKVIPLSNTALKSIIGLHYHPSQTLFLLSKVTEDHYSAMSKALVELEKRNMINKTKNGRQKVFSLNEKGEAVFETLDAFLNAL